MSSKSRNRVIILATIVALALLASKLPVADWLAQLTLWIEGSPRSGAAMYVGLVIVATITFAPGSIMMMLAGYLFGFFHGAALAAVAIPVAAQCAFLFARWFGGSWSRKKIEEQPRLAAVERALDARGYLIIILTRLSLVLPFNLLNYVYGATSVAATKHLIATGIGMFPAVLLYVYLGSISDDLAAIIAGDTTPTALGYWLIAFGIITITLAAYVVHKTASQTLSRYVDISDQGSS